MIYDIIWYMIPEIWSVTDIIFCHSGPFFALLPPNGDRKSKFSKKWKKQLKILSFYKHKWQSYDVWFLRYGVQWTECFVILDSFLPCYPTQKIKILKKWKNCLKILSFYTFATSMTIIWCMAPKIPSTMDRISYDFGLFFALLPC